jgi:hypothetical protein
MDGSFGLPVVLHRRQGHLGAVGDLEGKGIALERLVLHVVHQRDPDLEHQQVSFSDRWAI